jgi:hypothetical protein
VAAELSHIFGPKETLTLEQAEAEELGTGPAARTQDTIDAETERQIEQMERENAATREELARAREAA